MEYFSQIIKSQRAKKSLSALNVFGLSVCIGAALLILFYVRFELSFDSFHNGDRIYRVESRLYEGNELTDNWATTTFGHSPVMSREIPGIEQYVRVTAQDREQEVTYNDRQFIEERYCYTEPSFFDLFNFPVIKGEKEGQLVRPNTVVITESAAHRYFMNSNPIGKILTFKTPSSEQHFEVTGVIADMPYNSHLRYDFLLSYSSIPEARRDIWYIHGVYTYIRLEPGKNPHDIEKAFRPISQKYKTAALKHKDWRIELIPLKDIHLTPRKSYEKEKKGSKTAIHILSFMAVSLLLIGWVNALNLTIARYLERGREFGLRKVFGASRRQIIIQGLLESGLFNLLALIVAFGWIEVLLPVVSRWVGQDFASDVLTSPGCWGMALMIFICGTFFIGSYPSFLLTRIKPSDIIRGKLLHSRKGNKIRKLLIILQFMASFILISGTFVVIRQIHYMQRATSSVMSDHVLVLKHPALTENMSEQMNHFKKRLEQESYISHVAVSGAVPGVEVANYFTNRPYGSDITESKLIQMFAVDTDYLSLYAPKMLCGRTFSENYGNELNKVVLNEEAVRLLGYSSPEEALGQQLAMEVLQEPLEIIGVAENYHQQSLAEPYKPIMFFMKERVPFIATPYISIQVKTAIDSKRLSEIERIYKAYFPTAVFSYFKLSDYNDDLYKADRNFSRIFTCASLLAIFVACLGLWIMTLFSTMARVREIGIRKVLGAGRKSLFIVLTRELMLLTVLATALGTPVSIILMNEWLETYAFHITLPWWDYLTAFALVMCIALLTVARQVWRVIRLKPMRILRNE
ncbi:macrolide export ATP-binding/permease protein MacB [Bacteroidaceae bacterium]|uniref:ABC transporter permease n=1 Tax=Prevotella sp. MGM2 TaxID=2033406 RepID=UPI000CEA6A33|nr:ABC transporter permease [Prevotella sp. MGM2]GAY29648.1 ABC transporter permease [Prevotella sp. MGM2]GFI34651.1 macrolide export ATP-binding/permease protein MacB [Bacteroidaceae bacterium]